MDTKRNFRYLVAPLPWLLQLLLYYDAVQHVLPVRAAYPPVPSTIFLDTTSPTFTISTAPARSTISYTVTDFSGVTVTKGQLAAIGRQTSLALPRLPDDYYILQIIDRAAQSLTHQSIPFAVVAPFTPTANSPFGVGVHFTGGNNPGLAQLIATMGAGMIRDDATWTMIERSPGSYSFNNFDPYMQVLQQSNLDPLLILDYNNRFYDNDRTPYNDAGLSAFANYARALVTHYSQQLKAVEVYNEYNGTLSTGPCARQPACYSRMLRYIYQTIKAVRPDSSRRRRVWC